MSGVFGWLKRALGGSARASEETARPELLDTVEDEVRALLDKGKEAAALRRLERLRRDYPRDPEVLATTGDYLYDAGRFEQAAAAFDAAARLAPDAPYPPAMLAAARLELSDVEGATTAVEDALRRDPDSPDALYWRGVLFDLEGRGANALRCYERAEDGAPDDYHVPCRVSRKRFTQLAERAFRTLAEDYDGFAEALEARNLDIRVQDVPTNEQIAANDANPLWLGVFMGHMGPERTLEDPWAGMPAYIVLFQRNIERECRSERELYEQIHTTLLHEVAHAHGREEDWMDERGLR